MSNRVRVVRHVVSTDVFYGNVGLREVLVLLGVCSVCNWVLEDCECLVCLLVRNEAYPKNYCVISCRHL